jgi:hypothetical protein
MLSTNRDGTNYVMKAFLWSLAQGYWCEGQRELTSVLQKL